MCLEDLRMGRKKFTSVKTVLVDLGSTAQLVGNAENRVHIGFYVSTNPVSISPSELGGSFDVGVKLSDANPFIEFDIEKHGNMVTNRFQATADAVNATVMIIETFYKDEGKV